MRLASDTLSSRVWSLSPTANDASEREASYGMGKRRRAREQHASKPRIGWARAYSSSSAPTLMFVKFRDASGQSPLFRRVNGPVKERSFPFYKKLASRADAVKGLYEAGEDLLIAPVAEDEAPVAPRTSTQQAAGLAILAALCAALPVSTFAFSAPSDAYSSVRQMAIWSGEPLLEDQVTARNPSPDWVNRTLYSELEGRIWELGRLSDNWNGAGAAGPAEAAIRTALVYLSKLSKADLLPDRVVPSAEGGIDLMYLRPDGIADIEVLNSDEVLLSLVTSELNEVREMSFQEFDQAAKLLREFRG